ncbi:9213_t:CDS:2, partial [Racocetra fulgida]
STVASYYDPITIELMAQDTIELVKHLEIKRFNLFGGSMGVRPDSRWYQDAEQLYKLPELSFPKDIQKQKDLLLNSYEKYTVRYLLEHPDKLDKIVKIMRQWEGAKQCNLVSRLHTIKVPTLIIHGEADEVTPIQDGEILDREIPNTQFYRIPNAEHR